MKSYDMIQKQGPTRFQRMWLGVLCLRPRALLGAACILIGLVLVIGAAAAQSVVNFPSRQAEQQATPEPTAPRTLAPENRYPDPGNRYQPQRPPLASDPGVLQAPDLIARGLNESDAAYTARMTRLGHQLKSEDAAAQQDLAKVLKQVSEAGHGMGVDAVALPQRQPAPWQTPAVPGRPTMPRGQGTAPRTGWDRPAEQER